MASSFVHLCYIPDCYFDRCVHGNFSHLFFFKSYRLKSRKWEARIGKQEESKNPCFQKSKSKTSKIISKLNISIYYPTQVPESPIWLLSKCRPNEAQKSLQWLRGWVSPQAIHAEYSELEKYSKRSNACTTCARQSIRCNHPRPKLCENLGEFKRKRSLKPFILIVLMQFFVEFSGISFTFFPLGWSSFENANDAKYIQKLVGNFGCLAMILVFVMQFFTKMGVGGATLLLIGEVFPFK